MEQQQRCPRRRSGAHREFMLSPPSLNLHHPHLHHNCFMSAITASGLFSWKLLWPWCFLARLPVVNLESSFHWWKLLQRTSHHLHHKRWAQTERPIQTQRKKPDEVQNSLAQGGVGVTKTAASVASRCCSVMLQAFYYKVSLENHINM